LFGAAIAIRSVTWTAPPASADSVARRARSAKRRASIRFVSGSSTWKRVGPTRAMRSGSRIDERRMRPTIAAAVSIEDRVASRPAVSNTTMSTTATAAGRP
jgi:hypothetical protein